MARVVLTSTLADEFNVGRTELTVVADNVRQLLRELDQQFPGLGTEIERSQGMAIDGELTQDPHAQPLSEEAEVFVLPRIGGG